MKQAKASVKEAEELLRWLQARDNNKFENAKDCPPAFFRVVAGYILLLEQCCDPAKDYLDWKPGHAPADHAAAQEQIKAMSERANELSEAVTKFCKIPHGHPNDNAALVAMHSANQRFLAASAPGPQGRSGT